MEMFASVKRTVFDQQSSPSSTSTTSTSSPSSTGNEQQQGTAVNNTTSTNNNNNNNKGGPLKSSSTTNDNGQVNLQQQSGGRRDNSHHHQWLQQQSTQEHHQSQSPGSVTVNQPHSQLHQQATSLTIGEYNSSASQQNNPSPCGGESLLKAVLRRRFICSASKIKRRKLLSLTDGGESLGVHGVIVHHNQHPLASITVECSSSKNEVLITQPYSLPTSPVASPRPSSSAISVLVSSVSTPSPSPVPPASSSVIVNQNENQLTKEIRKVMKDSITTDNSTDEQDWQASKTGVRERNAAMCNNDLMADIRFIVSNNGGPSESFPAHKYVLATGSSVFFAMFCGPLAETGDEIVVPDVEPDAFLKMLRYLYADEIILDEDSVLPTLHVAKKYFIPHLAKACVQFMEASLTARNACILLCQSRIFDEPDLMQRCWEVIDAQAEMALNSEGFIDIDHATLTSILSRETLNCKELHVFNAAMAWATAECDRREIDASTENLRAVLGKTLQLIRVPTMELQEFADGPAQIGIFSLKECHDMFLHFTASSKPKLAYPVTPRQGLKPQVCHRFQSSAYRSNQWRYRGRCDSIQFLVDRRIFIVGFGLYGSSTGATTYGVHIELKRQGRILAENNTEFFSDGSSNTFHVYFRQPVQIDPDIYYTASAILDGMELSYFGQEGMSDVAVGNVTFQFQCSTESTNGTGVQGGQIPELIFYGPGQNQQHM